MMGSLEAMSPAHPLVGPAGSRGKNGILVSEVGVEAMASQLPVGVHPEKLPNTVDAIQFKIQLDKVTLWLEQWDHEIRCRLLGALLLHCSYAEVQSLWTVVQPATHRDFMFAAQKAFPSNRFTPISSHASRQLKRQTKHTSRYRICSAYLTHPRSLSHASVDVGDDVILPSIPAPPSTGLSRDTSMLTSVTSKSLRLDRLTSTQSSRVYRSTPSSSAVNDLPSCSPAPYTPSVATPSSRPRLLRGKSSHKDRFTSTDGPTSSARLRVIQLPVRRHPQHDRHSACAASTSGYNDQSRAANQHTSMYTTKKEPTATNYGVLFNALQLINWFSNMWNDTQRSEFLHKLLLKLDSRQHYFLLTQLATRAHVDFIASLPRTLATHVLHYLSPRQVLTASQVSKTWCDACNCTQLWQQLCSDVKLEMAVSTSNPDWKRIYRDNLHIRSNWKAGHCRVIECKGHKDRVLSVMFLGKRMATGSLDRTVKLWDLRDGRCLQTLQGHTRGVWCLRFFTNSLLISGAYDATIRMWNLRKGVCTRTLLGHEGPVWVIVLRGNTLLSGSQDKTAKVWDASRCLLLHSLDGHTGAVFSADLDEVGRLAVTGSADRVSGQPAAIPCACGRPHPVNSFG